jgi:hypothetical protein
VSFIQIVGVVIGGLLVLVGLVSGFRSVAAPSDVGSGRDRFLLAVHDAAKAGFWLALGAAFLGLSILEPARDYRWLVIIPIGMAGLRLVAALLLARGPSAED